jgi:hypothetical protein
MYRGIMGNGLDLEKCNRNSGNIIEHWATLHVFLGVYSVSIED